MANETKIFLKHLFASSVFLKNARHLICTVPNFLSCCPVCCRFYGALLRFFLNIFLYVVPLRACVRIHIHPLSCSGVVGKEHTHNPQPPSSHLSNSRTYHPAYFWLLNSIFSSFLRRVFSLCLLNLSFFWFLGSYIFGAPRTFFCEFLPKDVFLLPHLYSKPRGVLCQIK